MSRIKLRPPISRKNIKALIEKEKMSAYERGYEDGYDRGCIDMIDDDYGMDDEEEDTWDS